MGKYLVKEKFPIYHTFHKTKTCFGTMGWCNWEAGRRNRSPCRLVNMTITDDLVEMPHQCFLRSRGEARTGNAYAAWVRTKNDVFRIEGTKRLVAEVTPDKCAIGTQTMGSLKPAAWHLGIDLAVQSQELQCFCNAVEQIPSAGRGRTAQFVPIRFLFRNKLNRDDKLLLAFDAQVLSEVLSRKVGLGKIVHGENYATLKVKTSALASVQCPNAGI